MGLVEMSIILFIIITIGQYAVGWAAYAEKRYFTVYFVTFNTNQSHVHYIIF